MALTTQQCREAVIQLVSAEAALQSISKTDLIAAAAAADQWCSDNAGSYNTALPAVFKGIATPVQKAALLYLVSLRRYSG